MTRNDDVARFQAIFDARYGPLQAYARRRADAADVDDIVADTLATAWRRLADIPAGKELPWLYGTARRVLANRRRGVARYLRLQRRLAAEPVAPANPGGHDEVLAALGRLPRQDQEVLRLAAWEDLSPDDIATVLGCTPNAAALRLSRARQRLRAILTEPVTTRTQARTENDDV